MVVVYLWAGSTAASKLAEIGETHEVDFPIPFPLTEAEIEALRKERAAAMPEPAPAVEGAPAPAKPDPLAMVSPPEQHLTSTPAFLPLQWLS